MSRTQRAAKVGGGKVKARAVPDMAAWLAPAIEVDGPGGRRVPCTYDPPADRLMWLGGDVGFGAAVVVVYAGDRRSEAEGLAKMARALGYVNVRTERTER